MSAQQKHSSIIKSNAGQITAAYFVTFILLGLTTASLGPTLDVLASQVSSGINEVSSLFSFRSFGYLLGAIGAGRLYDMKPGHPLMAAGLILVGITMLLVPQIPLLWILLIVLLFIGIGEGFLDVGGNTLIVWLHGKKVGPFMNALHLFFGLGALLSPLIISKVWEMTNSIGWAYGLIPLLSVPVIFWFFRLSSPKLSEAVEENGPGNGRPCPQLIILLVAFFAFYVGAEVSFGGWVYLYGLKTVDLDAASARYLTSAFWGAFTFGRLLSIPLSARIRPTWILMLDFSGALLSLGLIFFLAESSWALWVGALGFGFSIASIFPTMLTFAGRHLKITARITGYFLLGATLGSMIVPWLIGQYFEQVGPQFMTYTLIVDTILAVIALAAIAAVFKRKEQMLESVI